MKKTKILAILVAATMLASCAKAPEETEKTRKERETTPTPTTAPTMRCRHLSRKRDLMPICASAWTRIHI